MIAILKENKKLFFTLAVTLLFVLGIMLYANALFSPVQFDDYFYVVNNSKIHDLDSAINNIWERRDYRKRIVSFFTFALNYHFAGPNVFFFHLTNVFIHIFSALAVWWLVTIILSLHRKDDEKNYLYAYLASIFFLVHPLQTEAVTYISQRFTSLSALFYILSVCFYILGRKKMQQTRFLAPRTLQNFIGVGVFALLAVLSKESSLTFPLIFLLIEIFFFPRKRCLKIACFLTITFLSVLFVLKIFELPWDFIFLRLAEDGVTGWTYLLTQFKVIVLYIRFLLVPVGQCIDHYISISRHFLDLQTFLGFMTLLAIFIAGIYSFKKNKLVAFGIFWFFITLSIESSIFPIKDAMTERRLYLPSVGFFIIAVEVFRFLYIKHRKAMIGLIVIIMALSILTIKRNVLWNHPVALWQQAVERYPNNPRAYNNLGFHYLRNHEEDAAFECFNKVIMLDPNHFYAHMNRAVIYGRRGRYQQAVDDYNKAIAVRGKLDFPEAFYNRGKIYQKQRQFAKAVRDFRMTIWLKPNHLEARLHLGNCLKSLGKYRRAIKAYDNALSHNPAFVEAYNNRGNLYAMLEDYRKSLNDYSMAIKVNPNYANSYNNRALVLSRIGELDKALENFDKAIELDARSSLYHLNRGKLYEKMNDFDKALHDYNMALSIQFNPQALFSRAELYFYHGKYQLAIDDCNMFLNRFSAASAVHQLRQRAVTMLGAGGS